MTVDQDWIFKKRWYSKYPSPFPRRGWTRLVVRTLMPSCVVGSDFGTEIRIWFRTDLRIEKRSFHVINMVKEDACRAVKDTAEKYSVERLPIAEIEINRALSIPSPLPGKSNIVWMASCQLSVDESAREISARASKAWGENILEGQLVDGFVELLSSPGRAGAWLAKTHPQLIPYVGSDTFNLLVQEAGNSLRVSRAPNSEDLDFRTIDSFLRLVSNKDERDAVSQVLRLVLDCFPADDTSNQPS